MRPIAWLALVAAASTASPAHAAVSAIDADGNEVRLAQPAQRLVTLAPSLAEIVFAAGAGERLVGISSSTDEPPQAARLPVVSGPSHIDFERLLRVRPDLIVAWKTGNPARELARARALGFVVFTTEPRTLADIARITRAIGTLAGTHAAAEHAAADFERALESLPRRSGSAVPTFVAIWHAPLLTINDAHLMSDVLRRCGGHNVFGALQWLTARVSPEQLLRANPRLIIASGAPQERERVRAHWREYALVDAVREARITVVDPRLFQRQGPRILEGAKVVCEAVWTAGS
jgi:iron complex transport system substrate-binding protein